MIAVDKKTIEIACFEVNEHGRLLGGNKRFCRMFGFEESEVTWHYMTDLCRNAKEWENFKLSAASGCVKLRMKNRKGRSFNCSLFCNVKQDEKGNVIYSGTVHRVGDLTAAVSENVRAHENRTLVFLAKCNLCGEQVRVSSAGEARVRLLCDRCAAKQYPEAFSMKSAQM